MVAYPHPADMMDAMPRLLAFLLLLSLALPAAAWNAAGHRLVAAIAWEALSPETRQRIAQSLSRHPDHERWQKRSHEDGDAGRRIFLESSTWADEIRQDKRFYDPPQEATPTLAGYPNMLRQRHWHYVERHVVNGTRSGKGALDIQLGKLISQLGKGTDPLMEAYALAWVIHLVADSHQPLHCAGQDDHGGNEFAIENPFNSRKPFTNLHQYWDDLPAPPWLRGARLDDLATRWRKLAPRPELLTPKDWIEESYQIARTSAYPTQTGSLLPIVTPDFHEQAMLITRDRIVSAGWRLGWLLEMRYKNLAVSRETNR